MKKMEKLELWRTLWYVILIVCAGFAAFAPFAISKLSDDIKDLKQEQEKKKEKEKEYKMNRTLTDPILNPEPKNEPIMKEEKKQETILNNGIINNAPVNGGNQTVNNYLGKPVREVTQEDITKIRTIPNDYIINFTFIVATSESEKYGLQLLTNIRALGYETKATQVGTMPGAHTNGERFSLVIRDNIKQADILVTPQE